MPLTLGYHLDVDIRLRQGGKHATCNTDHMLHMLPDQAQNRQIPDDFDRAMVLELVNRLLQRMVLNLRMQCHRHVHLRCGDEIHAELVLIQDREDSRKESMAETLLI